MKRSDGFTLIEMTIAIVVSGVVALLSYGTVQAGFDSGERIERYRGEVESAALMRSLVVDALRHPASAAGSGKSFSLTHGGAGDLNNDRLEFVSRGVSPPHGSGAIWNVTIESTPKGLSFSASPLESTFEKAMHSLLPAIHGMRVRVMRTRADNTWASEWSSRNVAPYAVELIFVDALGHNSGAPVIVVTAMEEIGAGG